MLRILLCACFHPYLFFSKVPIQVSVFKNSVVCVVTNLQKCFVHSEYKSFIRFLFFAKHFLPIMPCHFIFLNGNFQREDGLILVKSNSPDFCPVNHLRSLAYTKITNQDYKAFSPFFPLDTL